MADNLNQITPKFGISGISDVEFDKYTQDKITNLTGNADFPITDPPIADVKTNYDLFHPLQAKGRKVTEKELLLRNGYRSDLHSQLVSLGWNCASLSAGDKTKFVTSGFAYRSDGTPYNEILPSPTGNSVNTKLGGGMFQVKSDILPYSKNFTTRYGDPKTDQKTWTKEVGNRIQMIEGQVPGTQLGYQRAGNGKKGEDFYSKMIIFTVPFD